MIHVAVIAPTPVTRAGLHAMLDSSEIEVVASSSTGDDFDLTGVDAIIVTDDQAVESVMLSLGDTRAMALVVLTDGEELLLTTLRTAEFRGWSIIPSSASSTQLQAAVVAATQGLVTCDPHLARVLLSSVTRAESLTLKPVETAVTAEVLTPRELEVLELVGQGLSNKLIARSLHISDHTVKFHISSITAKLGASSRTEAVRLGLRNGLITL